MTPSAPPPPSVHHPRRPAPAESARPHGAGRGAAFIQPGCSSAGEGRHAGEPGWPAGLPPADLLGEGRAEPEGTGKGSKRLTKGPVSKLMVNGEASAWRGAGAGGTVEAPHGASADGSFRASTQCDGELRAGSSCGAETTGVRRSPRPRAAREEGP